MQRASAILAHKGLQSWLVYTGYTYFINMCDCWLVIVCAFGLCLAVLCCLSLHDSTEETRPRRLRTVTMEMPCLVVCIRQQTLVSWEAAANVHSLSLCSHSQNLRSRQTCRQATVMENSFAYGYKYPDTSAVNAGRYETSGAAPTSRCQRLRRLCSC